VHYCFNLASYFRAYSEMILVGIKNATFAYNAGAVFDDDVK